MKINHTRMIGMGHNRISFSTATDFAEPVSRPTPAARARWMIVDDDEDLLGLLRQMIELAVDVEVVSFSNSTEALLAFLAEPAAYDIIITDYHMPGMNGMELCRRLRLMAPDLGVILSTSDETVSVEEALGRGFRTLLRKPYAFAALEELLAKQRREAAFTDECDRARLAWPAVAPRATRPASGAVLCAHWIASL